MSARWKKEVQLKSKRERQVLLPSSSLYLLLPDPSPPPLEYVCLLLPKVLLLSSLYLLLPDPSPPPLEYVCLLLPKVLLLSSLYSSSLNPSPPPLDSRTARRFWTDYSDVVLYERGQLNPDQHQSELNDPQPPPTPSPTWLPQIREFNVGPWQEHPGAHRLRLNNFLPRPRLRGDGGHHQGQHHPAQPTRTRLMIPEDLWSAYCCTDYDRNAPHDVRVRFPSQASLAKNAKEGNTVREMTVQDLESFLKTNMDADLNLQIFYDNCVSPSSLPASLNHVI
ncbi:unnamed protein product [Boreogadus saida]